MLTTQQQDAIRAVATALAGASPEQRAEFVEELDLVLDERVERQARGNEWRDRDDGQGLRSMGGWADVVMNHHSDGGQARSASRRANRESSGAPEVE